MSWAAMDYIESQRTRPTLFFYVWGDILGGPVGSDGYCVDLGGLYIYTHTHTHTLKKSLSIFSILYIQSSSSLDIFWPFLYSDRHRQHMRLIYIHRIFKKCGGLREKNRGGWKKSMKMLPIPDESWISHSVFLFSFKGAMSWWKIRK